MSHAERCGLDESMAKLLRTLSSSEFSSYLRFICEALSSDGLALDRTACLIHLTSLALHNGPESQFFVSIYVELDNSQGKYRHVKSCTGVCEGMPRYLREQAARRSNLTFANADIHQ